MRKTKELQELRMCRMLHMAVLAVAFMLCLTLFWGFFSIVSHAESTGKVTAANGAKVRSSASTSASQITSYAQNTTISIRGQVQGSDGYTWYEIWTDADTLGYVRSDLVEITDGTTPPTSTNTSQPGTNNQSQATVSRVNPISATVKGGDNVRIRSNATTNSQIVANVQSGLVLTVNGQANSLDNDGKVWYQVSYISDSTEVSGFIREDYVTLSGELTPYTEPENDPGTEPDPEVTPETPPQPETSKEYDTVEHDGTWYVKIPGGQEYDIAALLEVNNYMSEQAGAEKRVKSQKVVIVILVFLLIAAAGAIGFLVYKIRDMMDSAYFNAVEHETLRRRSAQAGQSGRGQTDKKGTPQRPAGARPSGAPQGQRPSGAPQGQRPSGAPQGQKPTGAPQGQRPTGAPQGQRPSGAPQGQRPAGAPQSQRPSGAPQSQGSSGNPQEQKAAAPQNQGSPRPQPKNFMTEEDEFEFEFLNYEGEDNK